jgi:hypothetical protein
MILFCVLQGVRNLFNRLRNNHDLREEATRAGIGCIPHQVCDPRPHRGRTEKSDQVVTQGGWCAVG